MKKSTRTKIDKTLNEKFLIISENAYILDGKLTEEGREFFNEVVNEILNQVLNIEERDVNDSASFIYDDRGTDIGMEEIISYIGYKLVDFLQGVSRKDEKIFRGVVDSDPEFMTYTYKQTQVYYDEEPDVENPQPYTTTLKDLEFVTKENKSLDFEEEFNRLSKTNHIDWHNFLKKCLFTELFYESTFEIQKFLLSVFVKQANISKLTDNQREIIAKFIKNRQPYGCLSPNEKKQISRITHHKMNK
ncbi:hypothetical protein GMB34_11700 [Turicibacter sanguinis]|nr:hypothetical protein [Turicibacter sanguinis]MTN84857.1 hypothetical protein [Turicibacter sanguinis]MTN87679.1 hypothetical protein [Turicibacter sanguinis]MTN90501.1 hypothetical protein [Turicibacter sanguinis]MTN93423.1 hypothetical protein [Turicibacter sanguinis]